MQPDAVPDLDDRMMRSAGRWSPLEARTTSPTATFNYPAVREEGRDVEKGRVGVEVVTEMKRWRGECAHTDRPKQGEERDTETDTWFIWTEEGNTTLGSAFRSQKPPPKNNTKNPYRAKVTLSTKILAGLEKWWFWRTKRIRRRRRRRRVLRVLPSGRTPCEGSAALTGQCGRDVFSSPANCKRSFKT